MCTESLTIIVSGMIAAVPHQGGATWAVLQYLLGLPALGHRVVFIEPIDLCCVRRVGAELDDSLNAAYFREVMSDFELTDQSALLLAGTRTTVGLSYAALERLAREADLLLNISGMLNDENLLSRIRTRAFLDLDPGFVQLWHTQGIDMRFDSHTHFVTVGQAIGEPTCDVPACERKWLHTLQPVVLGHWPVGRTITRDGLTTIGNWRGYGSIEHNSRHYGQKAHSFRQFIDLPSRTSENFMVALAIHPGETQDVDALKRFGWQLLDPAEVAATPRAYQQFIQGSKAEFGIAKSGYVMADCGWFSDRSVCYLAAGRPVIAQETGFSRYLPTGAGLLAFQTSDDVLTAIESINGDYPHHCRAARRVAEEYFDSSKVLTRLLEKLGSSS